ncbi:unnamed protein product [Bursaphelenchus okinawaensis]|uniref:Uncharacterized protein n=1 Tax=Bursaphelenchus okinawaensis TaxID=465554 RepID=A0A811LRI6_9BILA|nr:unnamed protein product [Bursaphelenchus okinawaensis]CAG9127866.1 unnamed protein product [Bursaphelenchus okinawaensis]
MKNVPSLQTVDKDSPKVDGETRIHKRIKNTYRGSGESKQVIQQGEGIVNVTKKTTKNRPKKTTQSIQKRGPSTPKSHH